MLRLKEKSGILKNTCSRTKLESRTVERSSVPLKKKMEDLQEKPKKEKHGCKINVIERKYSDKEEKEDYLALKEKYLMLLKKVEILESQSKQKIKEQEENSSKINSDENFSGPISPKINDRKKKKKSVVTETSSKQSKLSESCLKTLEISSEFEKETKNKEKVKVTVEQYLRNIDKSSVLKLPVTEQTVDPVIRCSPTDETDIDLDTINLTINENDFLSHAKDSHSNFSNAESSLEEVETSCQEEKFFSPRIHSRCKVNCLVLNICRICGIKNLECFNIFEENCQMSKIINTFLPVEITAEDSLPLSICLECAGILQNMDDLAFRCLIVDTCLQRQHINRSQLRNAFLPPTDFTDVHRFDINDKVIEKYTSPIPTIHDRLEKRCKIFITRLARCRICGLENKDCYKTSESDKQLKDIINVFLPIEVKEQDLLSFNICLECLGILQMMDDLAFRFFNVESCFRQHFKLFGTLELNPFKKQKDSQNQIDNDEVETNEKNTKKKGNSLPSGKFPNHDIKNLAEQVNNVAQTNCDERNVKLMSNVDPGNTETNETQKSSSTSTSEIHDHIKKRLLNDHKQPYTHKLTPKPKELIELILKSKNLFLSFNNSKDGSALHTKMLFSMKLLLISPIKPLRPVNKFGDNTSKYKPVDLIGKQRPNNLNVFLDVIYEVYYDKVNGVIVPHHFKIYSANEDKITQLKMLSVVESKLRIEKMESVNESNNLSKYLSSSENASAQGLDREIIVEDCLICSICNEYVSKLNFLFHFKKKHMEQCKSCEVFMFSPESLNNHKIENHRMKFEECPICKKKLLCNERKECSHTFFCKLCLKKFSDWQMLLSHEEDHYNSIVDFNNFFKKLCFISPQVNNALVKVKGKMNSFWCNVCGFESENKSCIEECGHSFLCIHCGQLFYNHPLFVNHPCSENKQKSNVIKNFAANEIFYEITYQCILCFSCFSAESAYFEHFLLCIKQIGKYHEFHETNGILFPIKCVYCDTEFPSVVKFYNHIFDCMKKKGTACSICKKVFTNQNVESHCCKFEQVARNNLNPDFWLNEIDTEMTSLHSCLICSANFVRPGAFEAHLKLEHTSLEKTCPVCPTSISSSLTTLFDHLTQHSGKDVESSVKGSTQETKFKCELCSLFFKSKLCALIHDIYHHKKSLYNCSCQMKFFSLKELSKHLNMCSKKTSWKCSFCQQDFSNFHKYQQHKLIHVIEIQCSVCQIVFVSKAAYGIHMRCFHPEKLYVCKICQKPFVFGSSLTKHYQAIHLKKIFCCNFCYRTYTSEESLSAHSQVHILPDCSCIPCSNKKKQRLSLFSCDPCCQTFIKPLDFYNHHQKFHPTMFPYQCHSCHFRFSNQKLFKSHIKNCVEGENGDSKGRPNDRLLSEFYLCESCAELFTSQSELDKHILSHTNSPELSHAESSTVKQHADNVKLVTKTGQTEESLENHCPLCNIHYRKLYFTTFFHHWKSHDVLDTVEISVGTKRGRYMCGKCHKCFPTNLLKLVHDLYHHQRMLYQCSVCSAEFLTTLSLKCHQRKCLLPKYKKDHETKVDHVSQIKYICEICKECFISHKNLVNHKNRIHCKEEPVQCEICDKKFQCEYFLRNHVKNVHSFKDFPCSECNKVFSSRKKLLNHVRRHLNANCLMDHRCQFCNQGFVSATGKKSHELSHSKSTDHPCKFCNLRFLKERFLKYHVRRAHVECLNKCNGCNMLFKFEKSLKKHLVKCLSTASKNNLNVCHFCKETFVNSAALRVHCSKISENGSYECQESRCSLKFQNSCSLKAHNTSHSVTKYACSLCEKSFLGHKSLLTHVQVYHNESFPFHCTHCNRGYRMRLHYEKHLKYCNSSTRKPHRNYNKPNPDLSCKICNKLFCRKKDLFVHTTVAHNKNEPRSFKCRICSDNFISYSNLVSHSRFHFRDLVNPGNYFCSSCGFKTSNFPAIMHHPCKSIEMGDSSTAQKNIKSSSNAKNTPFKASSVEKFKKVKSRHKKNCAKVDPCETLEIVETVEVHPDSASGVANKSSNFSSSEFQNAADSSINDLCVEQVVFFTSSEQVPNSELNSKNEVTSFSGSVPQSLNDLQVVDLAKTDDVIYFCSFCNSNLYDILSLQSHLHNEHNLDLEDLELQLAEQCA